MPKRMENGAEVEVNNVDIITLQRLFYAMQDVCTTEERCEWENDRMYSITQRLTRTGGGGGVPSGLDAGLAAIEEAEAKHRMRLMEIFPTQVGVNRLLSACFTAVRTFSPRKWG